MLQLRHGVVHALLPRRDIVLLAGGRGRQLVPRTRRPPTSGEGPSRLRPGRHRSPAGAPRGRRGQRQGRAGARAASAHLFMLSSSRGCRAARRSNSFRMISVCGEGSGEAAAAGRPAGVRGGRTGRAASPRRRCSHAPEGN